MTGKQKVLYFSLFQMNETNFHITDKISDTFCQTHIIFDHLFCNGIGLLTKIEVIQKLSFAK